MKYSVLTILVLSSLAFGSLSNQVNVETPGRDVYHSMWVTGIDEVLITINEAIGASEAPTVDLEGISADEGQGNPVVLNGELGSTVTVDMTLNITNTSGVTWTAYELILEGENVVFNYSNTPTCNYFLTTVMQPTYLRFDSPNVVEGGQTVTMNFSIDVSQEGLFEITLIQNPVPEPVSIGLFSMAGLMLLRKKRA